MVNGSRSAFVSPAVIPAARLKRFAVASTLLSVSAVPAFAQSNINLATSSLERTSWTAAATYDPLRLAPDQKEVPANLIVAPSLASVVETMLQGSGTFRRQCARIAAAPNLTVHIVRAGALAHTVRAQTRVTGTGSRRVAMVEIRLFDDQVELIAHEIEHVIEQLDGIDLRAHAARSHSSVRSIDPDQAFETRRAQCVGRLVAEEIRAWQARASSWSRR